MSKARSKIGEALSTIDAIKTILEELADGKSLKDVDFSLHPKFKNYDINGDTNIDITANPFDFLVALLSKFMTREEMIEWLSNILVYELPVIELGIKGALLSNLKQSIDCNNDPRIPEKYRRKLNDFSYNNILEGTEEKQKLERGIFVSFDEIDYNNILGISPMSEEGQELYFGCRKYYSIDDANGKELKRFYNYKSAVKGLKEFNLDIDSIVDKSEIGSVWELARAEDFDAFLWFVSHKSKFLFPKKSTLSDSCPSLTYSMFESKYPFCDVPINKSVLNVLNGYERINGISESPSFKLGNTLVQTNEKNTNSSVLSLCIKSKTKKNNEDVGYDSQNAVSNLANRQIQEYTFGSDFKTSVLNFDPRVYEENFFDYSNEIIYIADGKSYTREEFVSKDIKKYTLLTKTTFNKANFVRRDNYEGSILKSSAFISKGVSFKGNLYHTSWEGDVDSEQYEEAKKIFMNSLEYERVIWNEYAEQYEKNTQRNLAKDIEEWVGLEESEKNVRILNKRLEEEQEKLKSGALKIMENAQTASITDLPRESVTAKSSFDIYGNASNTMLKEVVTTAHHMEIHEFQMAPVSYDAFSVNWYVNRKTYFDFLKKEEKRKERIYEDEFALCNLRYTKNMTNMAYGENLDRGVILTIMPKPFYHIPKPELMEFRLDDIKNSSAIRNIKEHHKYFLPKRILFDSNGKSTQSGKYTVMVKSNKPQYNKELDAYWYSVISVNNDEVNRLILFNKTQEYALEKTSSFDLALSLHECYPGITVYEFNYDFVMGMRLFDPQVIANKLITSLCNAKCNFGIGVNKYETPYQMRISRIIKKVIESTSSELSDCFFSFSNDEYNDMLEESEMMRANLKPFADSDNKAVTVDISSIRNILSECNDNATKQEKKDVLSRAITEASAIVTSEVLPSDKYALSFNFVKDLIRIFAQTLIEAIMSPKIMMLLAVNQKIMGKDVLSNYTKNGWEEMLKSLRNTIMAIVREISNMVIQLILEEVLKRIGVLVAKVAERIVAEQLDSYMSVLRGLVNDCIPFVMFRRSNDLGTELDDVNFAEIDEREEIRTQEC